MTQKVIQKQRTPVSLLDIVGFFVDLAMFLPQNKTEVPPKFRDLLARNNVTQAGTDYISQIDRKHVLSPNERAILAEEGTCYLLRLQYYYIGQMAGKTTWQTNLERDDPRLITNPDLFEFFSARVEVCLRALGVPQERSYDEHAGYLVASERYYRKRTWEQAVRAGSLYPAMMKLMRLNMAKRIVMTDGKRDVIDTYSSKIHGVAAKFYEKLERENRYVGIRHFENS